MKTKVFLTMGAAAALSILAITPGMGTGGSAQEAKTVPTADDPVPSPTPAPSATPAASATPKATP